MVMVPRRNDTEVRQTGLPPVALDPNSPRNAFGGREIPNAAQGLANAQIGILSQEENARRADEANRQAHLETQNAEIRKYEEEQRQVANALRVRDSKLELAKEKTRIKIEMQNKKGAAAADSPSFVAESWKKATENIRKGLVNDDQRAMFGPIVLEESEDLDQAMQKHVNAELIKHDDDQTRLAIQMSRDDASLNYLKPGQIKKSRANIISQLDGWASRMDIKKNDPELLRRKAEEISALHRDVLTRMMIDNQDTLAKEYDKENSGEILTDDAKVLNLVRAESASNRSRMKEMYESDIYNKAMENKISVDELREERRKGNMDIPFYEKMVKIVTNPFDKEVNRDGKAITEADRSAVFLELLQAFDELNSAEVDYGASKITSDSRGNRKEEIEKFRDLVNSKSEYLKREQGRDLFNATQLDYNDALAGKLGFFRSLINVLSTAMYSSASFAPVAISGMSKIVKALDPSVTLDEAKKVYDEVSENAKYASGKKSPRYKIGDIITNPNGIQFKVVGEYEDGEPDVEPVIK